MAAGASSIGDYRLRRQGGGRGAFAEVRVEVVETADTRPLHGGVRVEISDPASVRPGQVPEEMFDAARAGVRDVLAAAAGMGHQTQGLTARILSVRLNLVDSEPAAVRAAAGAATAQALHLLDRFEVVFADGWRCRPIPRVTGGSDQ
jgi:Elongation factor G, domain IV